jgi:hypothetical protein
LNVVRSQRDFDTITYFADRDLYPARVVRRHDGTVEFTWRVDDCDDRYVRATSSVHSDDYVLVSRNLQTVDARVLKDRWEIFEWVSSHLAGMVKAILVRLHGIAQTASDPSSGVGEYAARELDSVAAKIVWRKGRDAS